jgi:hypothetical protein
VESVFINLQVEVVAVGGGFSEQGESGDVQNPTPLDGEAKQGTARRTSLVLYTFTFIVNK